MKTNIQKKGWIVRDWVIVWKSNGQIVWSNPKYQFNSQKLYCHENTYMFTWPKKEENCNDNQLTNKKERSPQDDQLTNEKERSLQDQKSQRPGRDSVAKPPESSRSLLNFKPICCLLNVCWNWRIAVACVATPYVPTRERGMCCVWGVSFVRH